MQISSSMDHVLILLAIFRIFLETQKIPWERLPFSGKIFGGGNARFHRWGLYCACGYLILALIG